MNDSVPLPEANPIPNQLPKKHSFPAIFTRPNGKNRWLILILFLVLTLTTVTAGLAVRQIQQSSGLLELVAIVNRLPQEEQAKSIVCSRTPLGDGPDKAAVQQIVMQLVQPIQRATGYCLMGDYPSALSAYEQAASNGDEGSALQVYFLQARQGNLQAARQALTNVHFSEKELSNFYYRVSNLKLNVDLLPVAQRMVELYPGDEDSWINLLNAGGVYETLANWQSALDAYLGALQAQELAGVRVGRSSFEQRAGRIYQSRLKPPDLNKALGFYNAAITDMDFLGGATASNVFLYRGEVYQGLSPDYTASQALQEYLHSLTLDPKNMWAMRAIAGVYLSNIINYPQAEQYIKQAIIVNPDFPDNYLTLGDVYRQEGGLKAAAASYQDALSRKPGWQAALDRLALVQALLQKQAP